VAGRLQLTWYALRPLPVVTNNFNALAENAKQDLLNFLRSL
jgi:hypothetical protein